MLKDNNHKVIVVSGPTASGKSSLALLIAKRYGAQIVNADSMQIYKEMQIGTAKPGEYDKKQIKHHLFDIISVTDQYSAAQYVKQASACIDNLISKNIPVLLVGGTGLYIDSLLYNYNFKQIDIDLKYRNYLYEMAEVNGHKAVYDLLKQTDPIAAQRLYPNDLKRVIRALEVFKATGSSITSQQAKSTTPKYNSIFIGIDYRKREKLYSRINARVDQMICDGLIDEANQLLQSKIVLSQTAKVAIGYSEMFEYLNGQISLDKAVEQIKQRTRNYAKRQLTWFRKNKNINWYFPDDYKNTNELFLSICKMLDNYFEVLEK